MKKIVVKDGFAFVYFLSSFYTDKSILNSIEVYSQFFSAEVSKLGKYSIVKLRNLDSSYSLEILANEFSNYVLSCEYNGELVEVRENEGVVSNGF
ncbi:MAG: HxsD-like protein [Nanoarchaeota archaeon]|nr:HxsD-like protein [Nanoarchaeota archaeon]